jgi:hypothetical protein
MWRSFGKRNHQLAFGLAAVLATVVTAPGCAQTQSGNLSNTYTAPAWGQASPGTWGTYSGNVGQGGWQYNRTPQPNQPASGVDPNAAQGSGNAGSFTLPRRGRNPP